MNQERARARKAEAKHNHLGCRLGSGRWRGQRGCIHAHHRLLADEDLIARIYYTMKVKMKKPLLIFLISVALLFALGSQPRGISASPLAAPASGACGPMDVAFVVDHTTSMHDAINNVKTELAGILGNIETVSGNDYRLALVTFGDDITILENFAANNRAPVAQKFKALQDYGGGAGEPEGSDEALNTVVNALPKAGRPQNMDFTPSFRDNALRIVILVTDARPGGFDDAFTPGKDDRNAHTHAMEAASKGIRLSAVFVPTDFSPQNHPTVRAIMQDYATTTNGYFLETRPDGAGTGAAINEIIARCGAGLKDSDGDGLPDDWEKNGIPGANLPAMGADPNMKDVFVQINWMEDDKHKQEPDPAAIEKIVKAFANSGVDGGKGIRLHVDVGPDSTDFVTGKKWGSLGKGHAIGFKALLGAGAVKGDWKPFAKDVTALVFDGSPKQSDQVFRYAYFVYRWLNPGSDTSPKEDPSTGHSGVALGQVFLVSLGGFSGGKGSINEQAGTFMHELGHTLGLGHGGPAKLACPDKQCDINYKPNYLSVMNYSFQMSGLLERGGDNKLRDGYFDYSRVGLPDLNESKLSEQKGLAGESGIDKFGTKYNIIAPFLCFPNDLTGELHLLNIADHANGPIDWNCNLSLQDNSVQ
ncbi:MAG: VWA domain-containing protein, partial [Chloroflexota bacterium]|nr:VWA domain-containing protein [Chloroflexota bacterium]